MRITEGVILKVEHDLINGLVILDWPKDDDGTMAAYVAGVNDMAQAIIEAMREGAKTVSNPRWDAK